MSPDAYLEMAETEAEHWRFRARRDVLQSVLRRLALPPRARVLEVGSGTGGNLDMLAEFGTAVDPAHPQTQTQWYQQVPQVVKQQLPGVRAVLQWDSSVPGPDCDLSVNPGPAMAGYAQAGTDPYFHQPLPLPR